MNRISRIFNNVPFQKKEVVVNDYTWFHEEFNFEEFNVDFSEIYLKYYIDNVKNKCIELIEKNKTNYNNIINCAPKMKRMDSQRTLC